MFEPTVSSISAFLGDIAEYLPPGIIIFFATAYLEQGKYFGAFRHEFVGSMLMIGFTFSAGKWVGKDSTYVAWASHAMGVIAADYLGGGPHVNPAVTVSMWTLGKCSYTEGFVRIAAQLAGGLIAFPLYHAVSVAFELTPFGGPEFHAPDDKHATDAFLSEYFATILLMFAIYILNWELNFGKYHYIIKQSLTAVAIRALIECFPTAGPAMNPMLATAWDVFGVGASFKYPEEFSHYFVYWVAPCLAAITASVAYVIYAGGTIYGRKLPIGPLKGKAPVAEKKKKI